MVKVSQLNEGIFLLNFASEEKKLEVLSGGPWTFDNRPFIVKPWSEIEEYKYGSIDALPVWVRLHGIKAHIADPSILSILCLRLGKPICTDGVTADGMIYNYSRICVEVYDDVELQDSIEYKDPYGNCYVQPVLYEWKPPRYINCCKFGHRNEGCPEPNLERMLEEMKKQERKEFRQKNKMDVDDNDNECVEETPEIDVYVVNPTKHREETEGATFGVAFVYASNFAVHGTTM
ncbi:hypothetical protein QQ045_031210 [Rhodiola kirilowii]